MSRSLLLGIEAPAGVILAAPGPLALGSPYYVDPYGSTYTRTLPRMGNKTVYVREDDAALWDRAERFAKARRLSMSALIMTALEQYLADEDRA